MKIFRIEAKKIPKIRAEVFHEQLLASAGNDPGKIFLMFPQVEEDVFQLQCKALTAGGIVMIRFLGKFLLKDMLKDLRGHGAQQLILGLKMRIEGASANVCLVDDLLHGDAFVAFFLQQLAESVFGRRKLFLHQCIELMCILFAETDAFSIVHYRAGKAHDLVLALKDGEAVQVADLRLDALCGADRSGQMIAMKDNLWEKEETEQPAKKTEALPAQKGL